jgi:hypothetical protein
MVLIHLHVHDACPCPCCTSMFLSIVSLFHHRSVCVCKCMFVCVFVCLFERVFMCVFVCINAGMPDCPAYDQSGTRLENERCRGIVRYRTKPRQPGIFLVRYRTEIIDAGMPMPALVSSMPVPSYAYH